MSREEFELLGDLPRGVHERHASHDHSPKSRWATQTEILGDRKLFFKPDDPGKSVFLGELDGHLVGAEDDRHIITIAGSRAGKGVSALVPNLLMYRGSVLTIDPKGELACITAEHRAKKLGQQVRILDPFGRLADVPWARDYRCSYNPISILFSQDIPTNTGDPQALINVQGQTRLGKTAVEDAGLIADALIKPGNEKDSDHWDGSARNLLEGLILHVATCPEFKGQRHLITMRELLMTGTRHEDPDAEDPEDQILEGMEGLERQMEENAKWLQDSNPNVADAIAFTVADFFEKPRNERGSVLSTARRHTKFLDFQAMKEVLCSHDLDLTELKTRPEGMTIYLCLPATRLGTCSNWLRLFINLSLEAMERVKRPPPIPVLIAMDEFHVMGRLKQLSEAAGQIAGFGVKLWPVLQDLPQLRSLYHDSWETFLGNAGILQFFGNNDISTLEHIEKRLGQTTLAIESSSEVTREARNQGLRGLSSSQQVQPLLSSAEIGRYFARDDPKSRQLIFLASKRFPMILQRVRYYDHPDFRHKARNCQEQE